MRRRFPQILLLVCLLIGFIAPQRVIAAGPTITLSASVIGEGHDFATEVLGLPWDMNASPYPDLGTMFVGFNRSSFSASQGSWSITTATADPFILVHSKGVPGTQQVLKLGDTYPIDASKYKILSFRMCSDRSTQGNIYWFFDQTWENNGYTYPYFSVVPGCKVYTVDLQQFAAQEKGWSGAIRGLRIDPAIQSGVTLQLDWVRLSPHDPRTMISINWSGASGNLSFYINKSCSTDGAALIGTSTGSSSGTFKWGNSLIPSPDAANPLPIPDSFEPGTYSVFLRENGTGQPISCKSLEIQKAPTLEFKKPSMFSGPDYATVELGNMWDMSGPEDVLRTRGISSVTYNGGELQAVSDTSGDPRIVPVVGKLIDTAKYKYATYEMLLEGEPQNIGAGWVQRYHWWNGAAQFADNIGTTTDMIVYEGWHRYSIDLSTAPYTVGIPWTGVKNEFYFDPHESYKPLIIHLRYILLTGDEVVNRGNPFPVIFTVSDPAASTLLYYDTDKNPVNGRASAALYPGSPVPTGLNQRVYLPSIASSGGGNTDPNDAGLFSGNQLMWDTTNVSPGRYYISIDVNNGLNTTTWYSDVPVYVQ